ncbi:MAG: alpha/beta fold hydrolase [Variovorax sp.]
MAYWRWEQSPETRPVSPVGDGTQAPQVVICVHGLTRQGRDFDVLARVLLARATRPLVLICPDIVGRGESDWLADGTGYQISQYVADLVALIGQLKKEAPISALDYVGTSMGGLIGIALAGQPDGVLAQPIRRLVINDVGPALDAAGLARIGSYTGRSSRYDSLEEGAAAMWEISKSFGAHSREEWLALSRPMMVEAGRRSANGTAKLAEVALEVSPADATGGWVPHYDPAIGEALRAVTPELAAQGQTHMWSLYDAIRAETLVTRGAESDLLSRATANAMTQRGPKARLVEFDGVGHAPTFVAPAQSALLADFLLS